MSGAYVGSELESEFGRIPPSFLPLGNRRLFQHQIALAPKGVEVYLSIPSSFEVSQIDKEWLRHNSVKIVPLPDNLSLGESLVAALNISGCCLKKPLHVLYGDTLYRKLPLGENIASISDIKGSYSWGSISNDNATWLENVNSDSSKSNHKIIDGYFKINNPRELIRFITQSQWNFIEGLNNYHLAIGLTPVESNTWLDFGHVNTYYRSKAEFTTQRAFNELTINSQWIEKSSQLDKKIEAEANWFENIPAEIKGYTPQFLGSRKYEGKTSYRLEYLHLTALNELFVFSKLPSHIWSRILNNCLDFISTCKTFSEETTISSNSIENLFSKKTRQRLDDYLSTNNITLDKKWVFNNSSPISLAEVLCLSEKYLPSSKECNTVLHGDFCFSNILYDFRSERIKIIDPRGLTVDGKISIYGDTRYDLAKLSHSVLGLYDWIIAGYYDIEISGNRISFEIATEKSQKEVQQIFNEFVEQKFGIDAKTLYAMQIQLFLSMLPLHSDDINRQKALFANAFRLYEILIGFEE